MAACRTPTAETALRVLSYVLILIVLFYLYTGSDARTDFVYVNF